MEETSACPTLELSLLDPQSISWQIQPLAEPSCLQLHISNGETGKPERKPILTLLIPGLSLQSLISSSTAKAAAWGASQQSLNFLQFHTFFLMVWPKYKEMVTQEEKSGWVFFGKLTNLD